MAAYVPVAIRHGECLANSLNSRALLTDVRFRLACFHISVMLSWVTFIVYFLFLSHDFVEMLTWTAVDFGGGALRL